jgi:hypothetical protein
MFDRVTLRPGAKFVMVAIAGESNVTSMVQKVQLGSEVFVTRKVPVVRGGGGGGGGGGVGGSSVARTLTVVCWVPRPLMAQLTS